ncbi:hypothetical protein COCCADRAFT_2112 [Bipolaris zeicola 26-R-13]|uniref:Uncharacterized protein n=1 Tax=Cochliobolus carbonum (strain 26-R-13) TaxID=930089 RepID=W6YZZ2_COCC2|nr:uncharacterized protein COCCADRAFT_2112 [Bipolaris zeicola 26-R-13]EUC36986.1 hypothetical protein COCCADRAFT_2112 [Bipolaris zeicola 26-R-13]
MAAYCSAGQSSGAAKQNNSRVSTPVSRRGRALAGWEWPGFGRLESLSSPLMQARPLNSLLSAPPLHEPVIGDIITNGLIPTPPVRGKQGCWDRRPLIGSLSRLARNKQDPVDLFPSSTPAWRNAEGGSLC